MTKTAFSQLAVGLAVLFSGPILGLSPAMADDIDGARLIKTDYFENSKMSSPSSDHSMTKTLVHLTIGDWQCSGFFVKNSGKRLLIATARHCAQYKFNEACANGSVQVRTQVGGFWGGGFSGKCQSVVASDDDHDAVIFEAKFSDNTDKILSKIAFASLSTQPVPANTRLVTLGYPAGLREGRATWTDHCWVNDGQDSSNYFTAAEKEAASHNPESPEEKKIETRIRSHETMIGNNCDVYGGNSGGPVFIEGSDNIVVGMPAMYWPEVFRNLPEEASGWFASLTPFIEANSPALKDAGIDWQETQLVPDSTLGI